MMTSISMLGLLSRLSVCTESIFFHGLSSDYSFFDIPPILLLEPDFALALLFLATTAWDGMYTVLSYVFFQVGLCSRENTSLILYGLQML